MTRELTTQSLSAQYLHLGSQSDVRKINVHLPIMAIQVPIKHLSRALRLLVGTLPPFSSPDLAHACFVICFG